MTAVRLLKLAWLPLLFAGCSSPAPDGESPQPGFVSFALLVRADGTLVFERTPLQKTTHTKGPEMGREWVELSAPLLPAESVFYQFEGTHYPQTQAEREAVVAEGALIYIEVLQECAANGYPVETDTALLDTQEALWRNIHEVEWCAYDLFIVKPYWIPAFIRDVDICALKLGDDWRLIAEEDANDFSAAELLAVEQSCAEAELTGLYCSPTVFARGSDGDVKQAVLTSDTPVPRVASLPVLGDNGYPVGQANMTVHWEADTALRCIRRSHTPPEM